MLGPGQALDWCPSASLALFGINKVKFERINMKCTFLVMNIKASSQAK